jgi:CO/xanthine dehydrogenase Mo-binding subunit
MKGGGQQKEKVDAFEECERQELARQALEEDAAEAALQAQEAEEAAREAARLAEEAAAALKAKEAFQKRMDEDARYAAQELSKWHENYNKSSCNILGGRGRRGRIKNTFRKKNKSNKNKSKRGNERIKKNKRYSRKCSRK